MKKTISLILALCGVAMGAEKTITLSDYGYTDGFYATSVLSSEELVKLIMTPNVNTTIIGVDVALDNNTTYAGAMGIRTWEDRNEFHIWYQKDAAVNVTNVSTSSSFSAPEGYTWPAGHAINKAFTMENVVGAALTFAFAPKAAATEVYGFSVALTVQYADGTLDTIVGNANGFAWSNNQYNATSLYYDDAYLSAPSVTKDGNWTHADLVAANKAALVPEPTTATLSLLALAGLAARRRRK